MTSAPRAAWRRINGSLAHQVSGEVRATLDLNQAELRTRLDAMEAHLATLNEQVRMLRQIADVQVEVANESTEVLGRLLRAATSRIDELEEQVSGGK